MPLLNRDLTNFGHNYAAIIGITDYSLSVGPLSTPVNDARKFKEVLTTIQGFPDDEEHLFYKPNATKADFEALWAWMASRPLTPDGHPSRINDSFVFYFAGHGLAGDLTEISADEEDGERPPAGYLLPKDTNYDEPRLSQNLTLVKMEDLIAALKNLGCHHTLVILDCCFSGAFRRADQSRGGGGLVFRPLTEARFNRYVEKKAWQVLASAGPTEEAADRVSIRGDLSTNAEESLRAEHSPFAIALFDALGGQRVDQGKFVKALGQNLGDGVLTMGEIFNYVHDEVEAITRSEAAFDPQNPSLFPFGQDEAGQFVFLDPRFAGNEVQWAQLKKQNPYPGLSQFDVDDHPYYFGREQDLEKVMEVLKPMDGAAVPPVLIVSGASGVGKSSFMKAGILSQLKGEYELYQIRPGERPWELRRYLADQEPGQSWTTVLPLSDLLLDLPAGQTPSLLGGASPLRIQATQILLIDQYEELFTSSSDAERRALELALIELIEEALKPTSKLKIFLTIRSDFEWQLEVSEIGKKYWAERNIYYHFCRLSSLGLDQLRDALVNPALVLAFDFQKTENQDLTDIILEDLDYLPSALPLLSYTMHQMAKRIIDVENEDREFKIEVYQNDIGGVSGAMQKRLQELHDELSPEEQALMRQVILRMVDQRDGEYARRMLIRSADQFELQFTERMENNTAVEDLIQLLVDEDLLAVGGLLDDLSYVELVHDSLINTGSLCKTWIQAFGKENLLLQRQVWQATLEYEKADDAEAEDFLWHENPKIVQLKSILDGPQNWLNFKEAAFVHKSWVKRQDELERVKQQRDEAIASAIAARGQQYSFQDLTHGIRIAEVAVETTTPPLLAAKQALVESYNRRSTEGVYQYALEGHSGMVWDLIFFAHQGTDYLASAGQDGIIRIWDTKAAQLHRTFEQTIRPEQSTHLNVLAASKDGSLLLSGGDEGTLRIWSLDSESEEPAQELHGGSSKTGIYAVAISQDKQQIVYGGLNGTVYICRKDRGEYKIDRQLIDSTTHQTVHRLDVMPGRVTSIKYSADNSFVITADENGTVFKWNPNDWGEPIWRIETGIGIQDIGLSPDGDHLVVCAAGGRVQLRKTVDGEQFCRNLVGHNGNVSSASFSSSGEQILTGSWDSTAILWDVETTEQLYTFRIPNSSVNAAAFSPNGQYVATAGHDEKVRLWLMPDKRENLLNPMPEQRLGGIQSLSLSPGGGHLLASLRIIKDFIWHDVVQVWDLQKASLEKTFEEQVHAHFIPGSNQYLTLDKGGKVTFWQLPIHLQVMSFQAKSATSITIGHDGKLLLGMSNGNIEVWDYNLGRALENLKLKKNHSGTVVVLAVTRDATFALSGGRDNKALLWRLDTEADAAIDPIVLQEGEGLETAHSLSVTALAFSPDGTRAFTGSSDRTVKIWEVPSGNHLQTIPTGEYVNDLAVSPDGEMLIFSSWKKEVVLWDIEAAEAVGRYTGHSSFINALVYSADGKQFFSGGSDQDLRGWLSPTGIQEDLKTAPLYQLSLGERSRYGLDEFFEE